jgi:hypothetical protein
LSARRNAAGGGLRRRGSRSVRISQKHAMFLPPLKAAFKKKFDRFLNGNAYDRMFLPHPGENLSCTEK